jgi:hypothetical protein
LIPQWIEFDTIQEYDAYMQSLPVHELPPIDPISKQVNDKRFGQQLIDEFNAGQQQTEVDASNYQVMIDAFYYVIQALQMGNLIQAKKQLNEVSVVAFGPLWTSVQRDYFIGKIDNYLAP